MMEKTVVSPRAGLIRGSWMLRAIRQVLAPSTLAAS